MKVGVLSMHRVINYGSFLQAYALKQLLLQNGAHDVSFIDIRPGRFLKGFEFTTPRMQLELYAIRIKDIMCGRLFAKIHNRKHQDKVRELIQSHFYLLGIDEDKNVRYDLAVIGSDEVFNCCQKVPWGYTLQLYGDIPEAKRVISYAGSFGHTQYEQLVERNIDKEIGNTMKKMSAISVRDDNSFNIVKHLTGIEPLVHLDPVLAYGYQTEVEQATLPMEKRYIIVYSYPGRMNDKTEVKAIRDFAKKHNKRLYSFTYCDWCDKSIVPSSPLEVLGWFKGADYVVTDTFHGTIFSIITKRQFVTLIRPSNKNKIESLLKYLHLSNRGMYDAKDIGLLLKTEIDYHMVNERLSDFRKSTADYLFMQIKQL